MMRLNGVGRLAAATILSLMAAACAGGQSFDDGADPINLGHAPKPSAHSASDETQPIPADSGAEHTLETRPRASDAGRSSETASEPSAAELADATAPVVAQTTGPSVLDAGPSASLPADTSEGGPSAEGDAAVAEPSPQTSEGDSGHVGEAGANGSSEEPAFAEPRPFCGDSVSDANAAWCMGIENVVLATGDLTDASGDGVVSPGEEATLVVTMRNESDAGYNYPCIGLLADNPDVTIIGGEARDNPAWDFYAIPAEATLEVQMSFRVGADVQPGTHVHFVTWFDVLNSGCTNGNEFEFEVLVQ